MSLFTGGELVQMPNQPSPNVMKAKARSTEKIEEIWAKDTKRRKPREQQWQLNMSMVMGNQWVGWSGSAVQTLNAPSWRIQNVDNKIFVKVRSKITRLLTEMTPTAIPDSSEHIDIRRAEYKERLLHHILREINDNRLRFRAAQWLVTCGEVYTEVYWDESAGDTYAADGGAISEGEVAVRIWDPFAVWPGAGCSAGNNGGRLWTVELVPLELAKLKYGKIDEKDIYADATDSSDIKVRSSMENFFSSGGSRSYTNESGMGLEEMVQVRTLRLYRTKDNPLGTIQTIINKQVVDEKDLAWDGITHIINYPNYSGYHGDAVEVRNSIQQQKSFNRLRSNWEEYVRTLAKGKILVHDTSKIKSSQFDSEHMEIIKYGGSGPKPELMTMHPMPTDTANLMGLCVSSIEDTWSEHAASQGKAPASASGSAINYLQEEDSRQHMPSRDEWAWGWARTYEKCLDVVAGHSGPNTGYQADRTITILGENRRADVQKLDPDMIAGRNRIFLSLGGSLPENKVLRAEVIRRWFADGLLGNVNDPETKKKAMKMIDAGVSDDLYNDEALDEIRAEWENNQLKQGKPLPPRPEDDHLTHSLTHGHLMKSDEFLQLPPEIKNIFYDHKNVHDMALLPPMPVTPGGDPNAPAPGNSPAVGNPVDMLKSVSQSAGPPPREGAPGPEQPLE